MAQSTLFSSGIELATFVTSSGLLQRSWDVISSRHVDIISNEGVGLSWKVYKKPSSDLMIIAFEATLDCSNLQADLVSSSDLKVEHFLDFDFLCTKSIPFFSVNKTAVSLFHENHQSLDQLKSETKRITRLIVTGHAIGGSVASLFTMSLLDRIGSRKNRTLCITFGAPLVGDNKLQQAMSGSSNWNSCFLHVVSFKDPLPRLFVTNPTNAYMPFGTFLLCSDTNSTCFENPDSILEILVALGSIHVQDQGFKSADYGNIVENFNLKSICKDFTTRTEDSSDMQMDNNIMETRIQKQEEQLNFQRSISPDPSKKVQLIMWHLDQLEWYRKATRNKGKGYYDSYKDMKSPWDRDATVSYEMLTIHWTRMVEKAEVMPQEEGVAFRTSWRNAGTLYRRLTEPLAIAQYYREGGKDYMTKKRSKHFKVLEEWLMERTIDANFSTSKKKGEAILTVDSCFWAHVEEALLSCKELKVVKEKEDVFKKLFDFEEYVYGLLKDYAVSPDIFLPQSSFMCWWNEYKAIKGTSYNSTLANFMNDGRNRGQYALGAL